MAWVAAKGDLTQKEIAEHFGVHPSTVSAIFSSPLFQALVDEYRQEIYGDEADEILKRTAPKAANVLKAKVEENDMSAARYVLDKTLVSAEAKAKVAAAKEAAKAPEIKIILDAKLIEQMRLGLYQPSEVEDLINITPKAIRPINEILAELQAEEQKALDDA